MMRSSTWSDFRWPWRILGYLRGGVAEMLSPGGARLAVYNGGRDAVVVADLSLGEVHPFSRSFCGGCWQARGRFLAASLDEVQGFDGATGRVVMTSPVRGQWLLRWSDDEGRRSVMLGSSDDEESFQLAVAALGRWWPERHRHA